MKRCSDCKNVLVANLSMEHPDVLWVCSIKHGTVFHVVDPNKKACAEFDEDTMLCSTCRHWESTQKDCTSGLCTHDPNMFHMSECDHWCIDYKEEEE